MEQKTNLKNQLNAKIQRLVTRLTFAIADAKKFGPRLVRKGLKVYGLERPKYFKMWHRNALISIRQIRKQIYKAQEEMKSL